MEIGDIVEYKNYKDVWSTGVIIGLECWDNYYPPTWIIRQERGGKIRRRDVRLLTKLAPDAGDSAVSTSSLQALALSTSQAESAPPQRG